MHKPENFNKVMEKYEQPLIDAYVRMSLSNVRYTMKQKIFDTKCYGKDPNKIGRDASKVKTSLR